MLISFKEFNKEGFRDLRCGVQRLGFRVHDLLRGSTGTRQDVTVYPEAEIPRSNAEFFLVL